METKRNSNKTIKIADKNFLINTIQNGLFQLLLFILIPFIIFMLTKRTVLGFLSYVGLFLPEDLLSFPIVLIFVFSCSILLKILKRLIFLDDIKDEEIENGLARVFWIQGYNKYSVIALLFVAFITTGLAEEILFRGFLASLLIRNFGFVIGNISQALIFALLHGIPLYMSTKKIWMAIFEFSYVFIMAFLLGWFMIYICGGSILPLWIEHAFQNFVGIYKIAFSKKKQKEDT